MRDVGILGGKVRAVEVVRAASGFLRQAQDRLFDSASRIRPREASLRMTALLGDGKRARAGEQGFLLVGVIVMAALVLIALSVAAPIVARDLRREKELEAKHRGEQYVRAVRLYYNDKKHLNTYPTSVKALEGPAPLERYLRQHYLDPMTGKDDWKLIGLGQAKTTVKGFFGQPLMGLNTAPGGGLGSAAGLQSGGVPTTGGTAGSTTAPGTNSPGSTGDQSGSSSASGSTSSFGTSSFGQSGSGASGSNSPFESGTTGPFVGVGIPKEGPSIITLNEQTDYSTWEFIYDPRIEQLYAKSNIFGGGIASSGGGLGSASDLNSTPGAGSGTNPAGPGNPPGNNPNGNPNNGQAPGNGTPPVAAPTNPTQ